MPAITLNNESDDARTTYILRVEILDDSLWIGVERLTYFKRTHRPETEVFSVYGDAFPEMLES